MKMLIINSLKGLKNKKIGIIAIIVMVMLSTAIYTTINSSLDRIETNYYDYLNDNQVEHFSFYPNFDYEKDFTINEIIELEKDVFSNLPENYSQLLNSYKYCLMNKQQCQNTPIYENIGYLFDYYNAYSNKANTNINNLANKYNFTYQFQESKTVTVEKYVYKFISYDKNTKINIPLIIEGRYPQANNEITFLPNFLKENNLKINDKYTINNKEYIIVGTMSSPDYIYPMVSISTPMYQPKNHTISYIFNEDYKNIKGVKEGSYIARFNDFTDTKDIELTKMTEIFKEEKTTIKYDMYSALRLMRINQLKLEINTQRTFSGYFLYLLLVVALVITIIITKKRIEEEKKQIGILKAMGYNSTKITISYLVYPIIGGIIGGILGYGLGLCLNPLMSSLYAGMYVVPLENFNLGLNYLLSSTLLPTIILTITSFFVILFMLRHKALYLLKEGSNLKTNNLTKIVTKITSKLKFKNRFRYSLASRSIPKLILIMIVSFATGLLITLTLIGMNLFSSMIDKNFDGLNFDHWVQYKQDSIIEVKEDETYLLEKEVKLLNIQDKNGNNKEIKRDNYKININGIDKTATDIIIYNEKHEKVIDKLEENKIIINKNISEILGININDKITVEYYDKTIIYKVVDIQDSFFGSYSYVLRSDFASKLGLDDVYNKKFTSLEKYRNMELLSESEFNNIASVLTLSDLKENMEDTMEMANSSIYIIIIFSGLMAFIIISVIASIVIEENKKTISVMKVLGYNDKTISSIVLNIYTPFIIISYLLSVPTMITLLKYVVSLLVKDIDYALPIGVSIPKVLIGLLVLLIGYYVSIILAKRKLNKIPLSEALKRE